MVWRFKSKGRSLLHLSQSKHNERQGQTHTVTHTTDSQLRLLICSWNRLHVVLLFISPALVIVSSNDFPVTAGRLFYQPRAVINEAREKHAEPHLSILL